MRIALLAAALALPALADDVVVVTGSGEARVRPDRVVIRFLALEDAEKAADAMKALREKSAKVRGVLEAQAKERGLAGAEVTDGGLALGSARTEEEMFFPGAAGDENAGDVRVETTLTLAASIAGLDPAAVEDSIAAVVDAAVEAGAIFQAIWNDSGSPSVSFEVSDEDAARERAWDAAAADARKRAAAIAKRFGRELGEVQKLEDVTEGVYGEDGEIAWPASGGAGEASESRDAVVRASVRVTYRLR